MREAVGAFLIVGLAGLTACGRKTAAEKFDPETYTYLTFSDSDSLDPAYAYDTASDMIILNLYDTLFFFRGSSTQELDPLIAEKVPSRANGLISADGRTITIPIRKGVKFHDGALLEPEDVRYSIMRFMLYDRDAGPSSLVMQPLLGYPSTRDGAGKLNENAYKDALRAVRVEGNNVVLRIPKPYAPLLTIFAQWSPIVSKEWMTKNGDWDGTEAAWKKFNNQKKEGSPLFTHANGTGPFKLARWDQANKETIMLRNENYWRAPARLKRVVMKGVDEFNARKLALQTGDADNIYADRDVLSQLEHLPGVRIIDDLPTLEMSPMAFFTFRINTEGNPFSGSGKLDGDGIPPDFFSDRDVRKAFAYSFDYAGFIRDVSRGKGTQATGCIPKSLPGYNPNQTTYHLDPSKAKEHFQRAFGGKVWEKGFRFTLTFNTANKPRENVAQILKRHIEALNPKFKLDVRPIDWPAFLDAQNASKLPIFILGWNADYPDPHNFAFPIMHSQGRYPSSQHYANPAADKLVDAAIYESDPQKRAALYRRLEQIEYDDVPHLVIQDTVRYRNQREWVHGFVYNPVIQDPPYGSYFYTMYKSTTPEPAGSQTPGAGR